MWKCLSCFNDFMNHVDCVIKRDVYLQKMHSCSKYIRGISVFVLKISVVYKTYIHISWLILHGYLHGRKIKTDQKTCNLSLHQHYPLYCHTDTILQALTFI